MIDDFREKFLERLKSSENIKALMVELRSEKKRKILEKETEFFDLNVSISERLWVLRNGEVSKCRCGNKKKFNKFDKGYFATCGDENCKKEEKKDSYRKTCQEKYGVDSLFQHEGSIEKAKKTMIERYGVDHSFKGHLRKKAKQTMIDLYGVEHALQREESRKKRRETLKNRKGTTNCFSFEKTKKTIQDKYGVDNVMKNKEVAGKVTKNSRETRRNKIIEGARKMELTVLSFNDSSWTIDYSCNACKRKYTIFRQGFTDSILANVNPCRKCHPRKRSQIQSDIFEFISSICPDAIENCRNLVKGFELDIWISSLRLGFEVNGLYWHSEAVLHDREYHVKKIEAFAKVEVSVVNIWEDDWYFRKEIVKSIILQKLGKSKRIFARKCELVEMSSKEAKEFMNSNHLSGHCQHSLALGLKEGNQIVCCMTIGRSRFKEELELLRFASLIGYSVLGGFSKILSEVSKRYSGEKLISYRDRSFGNFSKSVYEKCGFSLKSVSIGYSWLIDGIRQNRLNFTKKKLVSKGFDPVKTEVQIMKEDLNAQRIWDCGQEKWEKIL